jgi:hypothetical protein
VIDFVDGTLVLDALEGVDLPDVSDFEFGQ